MSNNYPNNLEVKEIVMKQKTNQGKCKLCKNVGLLKMSHIIPRWANRRVVKLDPKGGPNPVVIKDKIALIAPGQDAEYLLCEECEKLIAKTEKYVASLAIQDDGSFPALHLVQVYCNEDPTFVFGKIPSIDIDAVLRFAASVIWRASVSTMYTKTKLGLYEQLFADYLLGHKSYPSSSRLLVELIRRTTSIPIDHTIISPESQRDGSFHIHKFGVLGMVFRLYVGNNIPTEIDTFSFSGNGVVMITDGRWLAESASEIGHESKAKGALARRTLNRN